MRFAIVNYGVGNLFSLRTALKREGVETFLAKGKRGLSEADAVVLPGVGGFRAAAKGLPREELRDLAKSGKPTIGICLGMQLFLERSEEGLGEGLGLFPGAARRLPPEVKVPQIGWNTIRVKRETEFTQGLPVESWVYYVHSYYPDTKGDWVLATTRHGTEFPAIIGRKNIVGTQFHPEKSGPAGAQILRNILRMAR
ncbi:MAG TPA: imidazole glycerol phosphate synthase subunit HisH [Nitrososphaerales archaeon]|nr:imidazole glycerol phosphate synthase subunit HisH [Nitrososphaerales archaeon]